MKHFYESVPGYFWFRVAYTRLLNMLPKDQPSIWVELGSYQGRSLAWLAVEAVNRGIPLTIHAVDNFKGLEGESVGADLREIFDIHMRPLVAQLNGRFLVHQNDTVPTAAELPDGSCDVVWVDAAHDYDSCKADILAWWPKVKIGGFMGGDDFMMGGVAHAVHELFNEDYLLFPGYAKTAEFTGPWPSWFVKKGPPSEPAHAV